MFVNVLVCVCVCVCMCVCVCVCELYTQAEVKQYQKGSECGAPYL